MLSRYDILQNVVGIETGDAKGQICRVTLVSFRWFVGCVSGCPSADSVAQGLSCADLNLKKSSGHL